MTKNIQYQGTDLLEMIDRLEKLKSLSNSFVSEELEYIRERLNDKLFRISVVGEYSSGKSTFINALIGKDILSHAVSETTAAITYIYNVPEGDSRNGSCVIELRNGKVINSSSFDELREYTTAQSANNVVESVKSVTVYVHFMTTDYPVLITDTPGLNGIAEHHEEITIEEVKKSHMCIYLLSLKGITNSDREFIKYLKEFQNSFLFLQNFKDELRASEGESIEDKIAEAESVIKDNFISEKDIFRYKVIGISALKALAAKDKSLKKIYQDDITELDDERRKRAYFDSNFSEFEMYLGELINSGEYRRVVIDSAMGRLDNILTSYLEKLTVQQEINDRLRANDFEASRIMEAQSAIERLEKNKEDRERRLRNFIISKNEENIRIMFDYSNEKIAEIYDTVCHDIDEKITCYNDYEEFESKYITCPEQYFVSSVSKMLNNYTENDLKDKIGLILHNLLDEIASRISDYSNSSVNSKYMKLVTNKCKETFHMDSREHRAKIDNFRSDIDKCSREIENLKIQETKLKESLVSAQSVLDNANSTARAKENEIQAEINRLGSAPDIKRWTESERVRAPRRGLCGEIIDAIVGVQYKTLYTEHEDDTEYRSWQNDRQRIIDRHAPEKRKCSEAVTEAAAKVGEINDEISSIVRTLQRKEREIESLRKSIQLQEEYYEKVLQMNQMQFCENQKNAIKSDIEVLLFSGVSGSSVVEKIQDYISEEFNRNIEGIIQYAVEMYRESVAEQYRIFEDMVKESTQQLEQRYESNKEDIRIISTVLDKVRNMI